MNENVIPHIHKITREDREKLNKHEGMVIWFTGLSGSGKSTLASLLEEELYNRGVHTYLLDGDNVRSGLNSDLDFTEAGRVENIRRLGHLAHLFIDAGIVVLSAFISPFARDREQVRESVGAQNFIEVFVDCPLEVCEKRDVKGLYAKARKGEIKNFTGIDSPFESPTNPDLVIHSDQEELEVSKKRLINIISNRLRELGGNH